VGFFWVSLFTTSLFLSDVPLLHALMMSLRIL